jgi:2-polyprenyl-6-hydroxyphenyl methylase/3-demethylubiquinone-9 3-methyltransferase
VDTQNKKTSFYKLFKFIFTNSEDVKKAFDDYHLVRRKYIVSHASKAFNKNKLEPAPLLNLNLLDIGCGTSKLAEEMTFRGADVTAIDPREDYIETAKNQADKDGAIVNFIQGTPKELAQKGEKFHIILCMDVFEYVDHTSGFLKELKNLLHEGGIVVFSTNNRNLRSWLIHIVCAQWIFHWVEKGTYKFKRFRSPKKLQGKLKDNQFEIIDLCGVHLDPTSKRWRRCAKPASRYLGTAIYKKTSSTNTEKQVDK